MNNLRIAAILTYCRHVDNHMGETPEFIRAFRTLSDLGRTDRDLFYWS
jgi:hypothetical protein